MQSGRGSTASHATEQTGEWDALLNGHPALLRLRTWIALNDPIRLTIDHISARRVVLFKVYNPYTGKVSGL
jgi:hypothetical protein